jgi:hypothetical protein
MFGFQGTSAPVALVISFVEGGTTNGNAGGQYAAPPALLLCNIGVAEIYRLQRHWLAVESGQPMLIDGDDAKRLGRCKIPPPLPCLFSAEIPSADKHDKRQ